MLKITFVGLIATCISVQNIFSAEAVERESLAVLSARSHYTIKDQELADEYCRSGRTKELKDLSERCPELIKGNQAFYFLELATLHGQIEIMKFIINEKCPDEMVQERRTVESIVKYAAMAGNLEILQQIFKTRNFPLGYPRADKFPEAFFWAARSGNPDCVSFFLKPDNREYFNITGIPQDLISGVTSHLETDRSLSADKRRDILNLLNSVEVKPTPSLAN